MNKKKGRGRILLSIFMVVLVLLLGGVGVWYALSEGTFSKEDWPGAWEVNYFYQNEDTLIYSGTLHLTYNDSLSGYLEIYPPLSTRPEKLNLMDLEVSKNNAVLSGQIIHESYKIKGGYLKEQFSLKLKEAGHFEGKGYCLEFCAEGTQGVMIIWDGKK